MLSSPSMFCGIIGGLGAVLAVLPVAVNAYTWDFETEAIEGLSLENAARVSDPALVVEGRGSILADSRASDEPWNEYLRTRPGSCPLLPETAYSISLRYRVIEPLGPKAFYLLLRSEKAGKEYGDRWGGTWESRDSRVHTKNFILRTGAADDYHLILGIRDRGAVVVDDLSIVAGPDPPEGRIEPFPFPFPDEHARFERSAGETGARAWARSVQVVLDPVAWNPALDGDVRYLARLNPDFALYLNVDRREVRDLGFPRSGFSREYQELYHADVRPGETWEGLVERYWTDGMARGLDGEPYMDSTWAEGGYFMCHASDLWHQDFLERTLAELGGRQGIAQDNIGVPALWKGGFAFCLRCEERFRAELRSRYDAATLEAWGVGDPDTFSIRSFLLRHSLHGSRALRSPVVREYIKFYHRLQIGAWADCALRIRRRAAGEPLPYLVNGNLIGAMGPDPYPVMLTPWVDAVYMEHWWPEARFYEPPRFHGARWGYKLAASAMGRTRPVWIENALTGPGGGERSLAVTELTLAEGLASGGYRIFNTGANIPSPEGRRVADVPGMIDLHVRYADFIRRWRGLFLDCRPAHRAAVVYSVPTHMFHRFPALPGLDHIDDYRRFAAACVLLERAGIPYDVVVFPHPDLMPEYGWKEQIARCDLVVCPGVAALSREQRDTLRGVVAGGGRVVAFGDLGTFDENHNPADVDALAGMPGIHRLGDLDLELGRELWQRRDRPDIVRQVLDVLEAACPPDRRPVVGLPAGGDVVADLWEDSGGAFYAVHLVNYAKDPAKDTLRVVAGLRPGIRLPEAFRGRSPFVVTPDVAEARALEAVEEQGRTWVELPGFRAYAVLVFGDMDRIRAKTEVAEAFNLGARAACLGIDSARSWWADLAALGKTGDGDGIRERGWAWGAEVRRRTAAVLASLDAAASDETVAPPDGR